MGYGCQIHHFLHRSGSKKGKTGGPYRHHILVIAQNRQCLCSNSARRNVKYSRQQFRRYFIHVGNHQQQPLRCSKSGCQSARLQRSVNGSCRTRFGLHFLYQNRLSENILSSCSSPLIHILSHR